MSKIAHIVAIKAESLDDVGYGITDHPSTVVNVLDEGQVWVGPRPVLEQDDSFLQPIPYIVIRRGDEVLAYTRGGAGGDARLHAKISIGFGGHVDAADTHITGDGIIDLRRTMENACIRELEEELGVRLHDISDERRERLVNWTHIIQSAATPVDRVHIGLVAMIDADDLPGIDPDKFEDVIENARWALPAELLVDAEDGINTLETWTGLILSLPFDRAA